MTSGKLIVEVTIPPSTAPDAETVHRSIAKAAVAQAMHQIGDTRATHGELIYNPGRGNEVIGEWRYAAPVAD